MMRSKLLALGVVLLGSACFGVLAGCGSSTTSSSPPERPLNTATVAKPTLSQPDLVTRMNAICNEGNAKIASLRRGSTESAEEAYARALGTELRIYRVFIPKLEALRPPPEARSAFDRYIQALNRQRGLVTRLAAALRSGESEETIETLKNSISTNTKARILAAIDLGTERCGQP